MILCKGFEPENDSFGTGLVLLLERLGYDVSAFICPDSGMVLKSKVRCKVVLDVA